MSGSSVAEVVSGLPHEDREVGAVADGEAAGLVLLARRVGGIDGHGLEALQRRERWSGPCGGWVRSRLGRRCRAPAMVPSGG